METLAVQDEISSKNLTLREHEVLGKAMDELIASSELLYEKVMGVLK